MAPWTSDGLTEGAHVDSWRALEQRARHVEHEGLVVLGRAEILPPDCDEIGDKSEQPTASHQHERDSARGRLVAHVRRLAQPHLRFAPEIRPTESGDPHSSAT